MELATQTIREKPQWYNGHAFDTSLPKKCRKKYLKHLKAHGYDDTETWSLDVTITKFILPRLLRFRTIKVTYPPTITPEEWDVLLDKMVLAFDALERDDHSYGGELYKQNKQIIEEGLDIFAKYYHYLWW